MALKERLKQGWIHAVVIVEILGKPKEYVAQVIGEVGTAMGKVPNVELVKKEVKEPHEVQNGLFSTFTEVEIAVKDFKTLSDIVFAFMPSHVEILAPTEIKMQVVDSNQFINDIAAKLHSYDALAKRMNVENMILRNKLTELGELPKEVKEAHEISSGKRIEENVELKKDKHKEHDKKK